MSVDNISNMPVQQSKTYSNKKESALFALGSGAVGLAVGGVYGCRTNPLVNKGLYSDEFVSSVAEGFVKDDIQRQQKLANALSDYVQLDPDADIKLAQNADLLSVYDSADEAVQKTIKEQIDIKSPKVDDFKEFLKKHADIIGIVPEEGQSLDDAINTYIKQRPKEVLDSLKPQKMSDNVYLDLISKVDPATNQRIPIDHTALKLAIEEDLQKTGQIIVGEVSEHSDQNWVAKFIDDVFDRKTGKFRKASEDVPQETINFVKKFADKLTPSGYKWKNAAMYGALAGLAMGLTAFISSKLFGSKS